MDGRNTYSKLKQMLEDKEGIISIHELKKLIMINIGSDRRTIESCLRIMGDTGLIQDVGDCKFKINVTK